MKNKFINSKAIFALALLQSSLAIAEPVEKIQCKLPGCTLTCSAKEQPSQTYGPAREVTVEVHQGGVIKYELDKGIQGKQSIYVGPDSYMCTLNQP